MLQADSILEKIHDKIDKVEISLESQAGVTGDGSLKFK
jgi:hypothetical protein